MQKEYDLKLYGYVILENLLHWIAQSSDLARRIRKFKSYTARMLVNHLQEQGAGKILEQFAFYKKRHKQDRDHQVWEEGAHPQMIKDADMLRQKLEYIHNNPVKRGYIDNPEHWRYSSARNYAGKPGLIEVYRQWS